jgi:hypothetical protein
VKTPPNMRYTILILAFVIATNLASCQTISYSSEWIRQLENPENEFYKLKASNFINKYSKYDFAPLIKPQTEFLGYIGSDYRRIHMKFSAVERVSNSQAYSITGTSLVMTNKCDFTGTITIKQIREFEKFHFGVDEMYRDSGMLAQGLIIGDYSLKENRDQLHSGEFIGIMSLMWFIDKYGNIHYDNIETYSDSYRNNQYVGIWKDYSTKKEKTCNWGEYRIPFSGDLDIGAGEFSPNEKYYDKGWKQTK